MNLVPYSTHSLTMLPQTLPRAPQEKTLPGQAEGVYIAVAFADSQFQFILNKMVGWFRDREEVELVDHGTTDKLQLGYLILEWHEVGVDQLFLDILRDEEWVHDYTVYLRDL